MQEATGDAGGNELWAMYISSAWQGEGKISKNVTELHHYIYIILIIIFIIVFIIIIIVTVMARVSLDRQDVKPFDLHHRF